MKTKWKLFERLRWTLLLDVMVIAGFIIAARGIEGLCPYLGQVFAGGVLFTLGVLGSLKSRNVARVRKTRRG